MIFFEKKAWVSCVRSRFLTSFLSVIFGGVAAVNAQTNIAATVKHAPSINGRVEGSVRQFLGEGLTFNSGAVVTGNLIVPGSPGLSLNGSPTFGGVVTNSGSSSPTGYWITLNSGSTLGNLIIRTDAGTLTSVSTPPAASGTRSVNINSSSDSAGDFSTLKNLTLNSGGVFAVPSGTYDTFTANSGTGFRLGVTNGTSAAVYNFQSLNLNGSAEIQIVGPVEIRVKNGFSANGVMGNSAHPDWLIIKITSGGFNFNSAYTMYGHVIAPNGTVTINSGCTIAGTVEADRLTLNSNGKLQWATAQAGSNQEPLANAQNVTTSEDVPVALTLTGSDPEGSSLVYTVVGSPSHGSLSGSAPNLTYTPGTNYFGADSFTFKVNDGMADSSVVTVSLTVTPVNDAPLLAALADRSIMEGLLLSITNTVTDVDSTSFTYSLGTNAPFGMSINTTNGMISWTPTEAQGPSTNTVSITVTDNGTPALSDTKTFTITVLETNTAPVLAAISNQVVYVGQMLMVTNAATDADLPLNTLTYSLGSNAPTGMGINATNGLISWTPVSGQGNTTNLISVIVRDNGMPPLSNSFNFVVTVLTTNHAPVFGAITNSWVNEFQLLANVAVATDPDGDALVYSLGTNAPAGMSINATNGLISWIPGELDGGTTNVVTLIVTDNGVPAKSATTTFEVRVLEANIAPVLTVVDQVVVEGQTLVITNVVTDADVPANSFTFTLDANAPAGMSINPTNGIITWTPTEAQGPSTNNVLVTVTDNGFPAYSDTKGLQIIVLETNSAPVFGPITNVTVVEQNLLIITNIVATDIDEPVNVLTYSLGTNSPSGMVINSTNGVITWTPSEAQGPSTNLITVIITDDGTPSLSATQTFTVTVLESNSAPVMQAPATQTVMEGQLLVVTNLVTDADIPANALSFSLGTNAPVGMSINPTNGVITWTPSEVQGPSTNLVEVLVADNGVPSLGTNVFFIVKVLETNSAPVLMAITNRSVLEGQTLMVSVSAIDTDLPMNTLSYDFVGAIPAGMVIDANTGIITWTPSEVQGPSTNSITVRVTDDGVPALSHEQVFTVVVEEVNSAPILLAVPDQTVIEGHLLLVTNLVTDIDYPANTFTFSLGSNAPVGVSINATNGVVSWTPNEAQGPATHIITVIVADNGLPALSATNTFVVTVLETNAAPVLASIPNQTITEHDLLSLNITATDTDFPVNNLSFSLAAGAPAGVFIDANSGVLTWTPSEAQGPSTNNISVIVSDNGVPSLSATQSFTVIVRETNSPPIMQPPANQVVFEGLLLVMTNNATDLDIPANTLTYSFGAGAQNGMVIDADTGVITWTPNELQGPSTNVIEIVVTDNGVPSMSTNVFFTITVLETNSAPVLAAITNQIARVGLFLSVTNVASDADYPANTLTFSLGTNVLTGIEINPTSGVVTWAPTVEFAGSTNTVEVIVADNGVPSLSATQRMQIYVDSLNTAPVITLQSNLTVEAGSVLQLTALVTDDGQPIAGFLTNQWSVISGSGQLVLSNATTLNATAVFASAGEYVFRLIAGDGQLTSTATVTVTVTPRNEAPRVTAGPNQFARLPATIPLLGYATDDGYPLSGHLSFLWTQVSGPAAVSLSNPTGTNTMATFPLVGDYVLRLMATDSVLTNQADVRIGIRDALTNQPPVVNAGQDIKVGLTNAVPLVGTATDDGLPATNTLAVHWEMISGPAPVTFDDPNYASTLALFETNGTYVLRLSANDGEYTATDEVTVTVYLNNLPPVVDAGPDLTLLVPDPSVLTAGGKQPRDSRTEFATTLFGQAHWNTKVGQPGLNFGVIRNGLSYSGKYLFATGPYEYAGTNFVGGVARWDGTNWTALFDNRPSDPNDPLSPPFGLATFDYRYTGANDSRGEELFLAGAFLRDVGGYGGGNLTAQWNGSNWLGWSWHGQSSVVSVEDVLVTKDAVYVSGGFSFQPTNAFAGGSGVTFTNLPVSHSIAKWTGTQWTNLADGILTYNGTYGTVRVMAEGKDGEIYAAGQFEMPTPFGGATNIAVWNGTNWAPLGNGIKGCYRFNCSPNILAMAVDDDGKLYVGGDIAIAGNESIRSIAMWDGANWHALGNGTQNGVQGEVQAIVTYGRDVYVAGIGEAGGIPVNTVARWNGEFWSPLGSGSSNGVLFSASAMAASPHGIYFGGVFAAAGGMPAECIALWEFPPEPERFVRLNGRVTDDGLPYANSLSQQWTKVSGPGEVVFGDATAASTTATFTALGQYVLRLTANDTEFTVLDEVSVEVKGNLPPQVNAGTNLVGRVNEPVDLKGSVIDDGLPEQASLVSLWTQVGGPAVAYFNNPGVTNTYATFPVVGTYVFRLQANDSQFSRYDDVTIVISEPNSAPAATITTIGSPNLVAPIQLNGNPSDDGQPIGIMTYQWTKVSGPGVVYFSDASAATSTARFGQPGTYVISFTVSDGELTTRREIALSVGNASASGPFVYAGCSLSARAGQSLSLPAVIESQTGNATIEWSVRYGPGDVSFSDTHVMRPSVVFSAPGTYYLDLTVQDANGSQTQSVMVTVKPALGSNQPPSLGSLLPFWVFDSTNTVPLVLTVADDGLPLTGVKGWSWSKLSGPGTVSFNPTNSSQLGTNIQTLATFSQPGTYFLQVTVTDSEFTTNSTVEIRVVDKSLVGTEVGDELMGSASAGPDAQISLGQVYTGQAGGENYYGGSWRVIDGPGRVIIDGIFDPHATMHFSDAGVYQLRWSGISLSGPVADDVLVTVTSSSTNRTPVVDAGDSIYLYAPANSTTLHGSLHDDGLPVGGNVTYEWIFEYGDTPVTIQNPNSLETTVTFDAPTGEYAFYWFTLRASDGENTSDSYVYVEVVDPNIEWWIPTNIDAGPDRTVAAGSTTKLEGTADTFNDTNAYLEWQQVSGPVNVVADDWYSPAPTIRLKTPGVYVFRCIFWGDVTANDLVTITVPDTGNTAPFVDAGPEQRIFLAKGYKATLAGRITDDGQPANGQLLARWEQVSGPALAYIASPDSAVSEVYAVVPGNYVFRLSGDDGATVTSSTVNLEVVTGMNFFDAPLSVEAGSDVSLPTGSYFNGTGSVSGGAYYASEWTQVSGPAQVSLFQSAQNMQAYMSLPGVYVFRFTARNGYYVDADEVVVTVQSGEVNLPPTVWSGNYLPVMVGQPTNLRILVANDCLPATPEISGEWTVESGPGTVTFGAMTITNHAASHNVYEVMTEATFDQPGYYSLWFYASDGEAVSPGRYVLITVLPEPAPNEAPLVSAGADFSAGVIAPFTLTGYATDDGLLAGSTLRTGWSLISGPSFASFTDSSVTNTTVSVLEPGTYVFRLSGSDGQLTAFDDVTVTVLPAANEAPIVFAGYDATVTRPRLATLEGIVLDDGLPVAYPLTAVWSKVSGPGPVAFGSLTNLNTTASFSIAGTYVLRLTATDGELTESDEVTINVLPGVNEAPVVDAGTDFSTTVGTLTPLGGTVTDDGLPTGYLQRTWSKVSGPGTAQFSSLNDTNRVVFSAEGTYVLRLTATDSVLTTTDDIVVLVYPPTARPTVEITSPGDATEVTAPTAVTGTASSPLLDFYVLEYRAVSSAGGNDWVQLASNTVSVVNGTLGSLDPTLSLNGIYEIRVRAKDTLGRTSVTEPVSVIFDRNMKIGNFAFSFNDLTIPVAGIPITITRSYDSRNKEMGDFGVGWTMDINNIRLQKNRHLGINWEQTVEPGLFPVYGVRTTRSRVVTITFPNDKVYKFAAVANPDVQFGIPLIYPKVEFIPYQGTYGTLTPLVEIDGELYPDDQVVYNGDYPGFGPLLSYELMLNPPVGPADNVIFNPDLFEFKTQEGYSYIISETNGLRSVTDPSGNTLTITAEGIIHSSGKSILFERDTLGRITNIVDTAGNSLRYIYDNAGDLSAFVDRSGHTNTFTYDGRHNLITMADPNGIVPLDNQYDTSGRLIGHTDVNGQRIEYVHDIANRVTSVRDRNGSVTTQFFNESGDLVRTVNPLGHETSMTYDALGRRLTMTNPLGETTRYVYDPANGGIVQWINALNQTNTFTYNSQGQVVAATERDGTLLQTLYNDANKLMLGIDTMGYQTSYAYNDLGKAIYSRNALGHEVRSLYDASGNLLRSTNALGHVTEYAYDANNNLIQQVLTRTVNGNEQRQTNRWEYDVQDRAIKAINSDGSFQTTTFDDNGRMIAKTDELGRQTSYAFDLLGNLVLTTYPDNTTEGYAYDREGRKTAMTNRLGQVTRYLHDSLGRVVTVLAPDGTGVTNYFNPAGRVIATSDAKGNTSWFGHDAIGRIVAMTNALGEVTTYTYDARGNQITATDALGRTTTNVFNLANRLIAVLYPDGTSTSLSYDALHRKVSETDQLGRITFYGYDNLSRLVAVTNALGFVTRYEYNELGEQTAQIDANGRITRYEYDSRGRRTSRILPLGQSDLAQYDALGRLIQQTDFNGNVTTYQYDVMNRLLQKTPDVRLGEPAVTFTYNDLGQRTSMTDSSGVTTYQYDLRNRLVQKLTPQGSLTYTYDANSNVLTVSSGNINGTDIAYEYDALNRLSAVNDTHLGRTTYHYDAVGNLHGFTYPNGVNHFFEYDALNRLTNLTSSTVLETKASYRYVLAPTGHRLTTLEADGRVVNYTYDLLNRLTQESVTGGTYNGSVGYSYDAVGNRLARNSNLPGIMASAYAYDANDRLATDSYDANGNTLAANLRANTSGPVVGVNDRYDSENRLVNRNNGQIVVVYDGDGQRVRKTVGGVTTHYLVDDLNPSGYAQVVEELTSTGGAPAVTRIYSWGHALLAQDQYDGNTWSESWFGYDGQGSVRFLTDGNATVTDRYSYDAFGNIVQRLGNTANNYLYQGEQFDPDLGLYYLRARYADTDRGRFWTQDSFEGFGADPQSLHKYTINHNDPVNRHDPSGHTSLTEESTVAGLAPTVRGAVQQVMRNFVTCRMKSAAMAAAGGAAIGGVLGGGIELLIQKLTGDGTIDWAQVGASALDGAKTGALEGALLAMSPTAFYVYEIEQTLQGAYDLYNVINDPQASSLEKIIAATGFVAQALPVISPRLAKRLSDALQQFCFPAGTEIAVVGGSKRIEEIEVGEMVWAQSDRTGEVELKRVKQLFVNVAASLVVITTGTNTIEATDEHPFWVAEQGWKAAGQVQVGDELWTRSGERIRVTEVGHKKGQFTVYNFEVEDAHTYFAGDKEVLVHNNGGDCAKKWKFGPQHGEISNWGAHLESLGKPKPDGMIAPHAHHTSYKKGQGSQVPHVERANKILEDFNIDWYRGSENLDWAPNVAGQHTTQNIKEIADTFERIKNMGGTREDIIDALKRFQNEAKKR